MKHGETETDDGVVQLSRGALAGMLLLGLLPLAGGCGPTLVIGAGAAAGNAAAQERGFAKSVSDGAVETTISAKLLSHSGRLFTDVGVEVHEGRVLLTGAVEKIEHRIEAVRIAWQTGGVREVINEIQVRDDSGVLDAARDGLVTTELSTKITFDQEIKGVNYSIETVNGTVYLIGVAQSQTELDRVINHARQISYVRRIVSHVRVKPAQRPGDKKS
jgi:osmotically-inducible protein OsmY